MKPKIKEKNGRYFVVFEIEKNTAIDYSNKLETHKYGIICVDEREKSYPQVKYFWALLDEFAQHLFPDEKLSKKQKEELKEALYIEYNQEKGLNLSLSQMTVYDARLFLEYISKMFADKYNFVPKETKYKDAFTENYVYACIVSGKCAVCGQDAKEYKKMNKCFISLCNEHKDLKRKEIVEQNHLIPIKISENTIEILKGNNETN